MLQLLRRGGRQGFLDRFERHCEGLQLTELTLVGMRILRAETAVAERPAAGRSPVMQPGSQSSASISSTYTRPR